MADLKKAYEAIKMLKSIGIAPSREQMRAIHDMENDYLENDVIPLIEAELAPLFSEIRGDIKLDMEYTPESGISVKPFQRQVVIQQPRSKDRVSKRSRQGKQKYRIRVTFPNNVVSCKIPVFETLMDVIRYAGPERVQKLNMVVMGDNIVSPNLNPDERYRTGQKEIKPGLYVCTFSSTETKLTQINYINKALNLGLLIEKEMF